MCGRFASARKRIELLEEFGVQRDRVETELRPDYNVAPTKSVYAVLTRHSAEKEAAGDKHGDGQQAEPGPALRQLRVVRWGLVPYWAKDPGIGSRMINARAETVAEKPAYRRAFAKRRCLLPADGFYEWQQLVGEDGKKHKQPYYIYRADGGVLAFAGLYELWRDASVPEDSDRAWLWTTTIITTTATDEVGQIHDRMPMVIEPAAWQDWLDPDNTEAARLQDLLVPAVGRLSGAASTVGRLSGAASTVGRLSGAASAEGRAVPGGLTSHPVSTAVNNVRNNGPELTEAVPGPSSGR